MSFFLSILFVCLILGFSSTFGTPVTGDVSYDPTLCVTNFTLVGLNGEFTYPTNPGQRGYYNNCHFYIHLPINQEIDFTVEFYDIDASDKCTKDYLNLFSNQASKTYCGTEYTPFVLSAQTNLLLEFKSDEEKRARGFSFSWKPSAN